MKALRLFSLILGIVALALQPVVVISSPAFADTCPGSISPDNPQTPEDFTPGVGSYCAEVRGSDGTVIDLSEFAVYISNSDYVEKESVQVSGSLLSIEGLSEGDYWIRLESPDGNPTGYFPKRFGFTIAENEARVIAANPILISPIPVGTGSIHGQISSEVSLSSLVNLTVNLQVISYVMDSPPNFKYVNLAQAASPDQNGNWSFSALPAGTYALDLTFSVEEPNLGLTKPAPQVVTLGGGESKAVNFDNVNSFTTSDTDTLRVTVKNAITRRAVPDLSCFASPDALVVAPHIMENPEEEYQGLTTDENGVVEFTDLFRGQIYSVQCIGRGEVRVWADAPRALIIGEGLNTLTVSENEFVRTGNHVSGHVINGDTGLPVEGMEVAAGYADPFCDLCGEDQSATTTDGLGYFNLEVPNNSQISIYTNETPNFAKTHSSMHIATEPITSLEIQVRAGVQVRGNVIDSQGNPVSGGIELRNADQVSGYWATVNSLGHSIFSDKVAKGSYKVFFNPEGADNDLNYAAGWLTESGNLSPRESLAATFEIGSDFEIPTITTSSGRSARGLAEFQDAMGNPISGQPIEALVGLYVKDGSNWSPTSLNDYASAQSGGNYSFTNLGLGTYKACFESAPWASAATFTIKAVCTAQLVINSSEDIFTFANKAVTSSAPATPPTSISFNSLDLDLINELEDQVSLDTQVGQVQQIQVDKDLAGKWVAVQSEKTLGLTSLHSLQLTGGETLQGILANKLTPFSASTKVSKWLQVDAFGKVQVPISGLYPGATNRLVVLGAGNQIVAWMNANISLPDVPLESPNSSSKPTIPIASELSLTLADSDLIIAMNYSGSASNAPSEYRVILSPGNQSCTIFGSQSDCKISQLGQGYKFRVSVVATNSFGESKALTSANSFIYTTETLLGQGKSMTVRGFQPGSAKLSKTYKAKLSSFIKKNPQLVRISCEAFIAGNRLTASGKKLARSQARAACGYLKSIRPTLITSVPSTVKLLPIGLSNQKVFVVGFQKNPIG